MVHRDLRYLEALPRMSQPMVAHAVREPMVAHALPRMSQPMVIRNGCNYVAAHAVRAVFDHRSSFINDP